MPPSRVGGQRGLPSDCLDTCVAFAAVSDSIMLEPVVESIEGACHRGPPAPAPGQHWMCAGFRLSAPDGRSRSGSLSPRRSTHRRIRTGCIESIRSAGSNHGSTMPKLWDAAANDQGGGLSRDRSRWLSQRHVVFALLPGGALRGSRLHTGADGVDRGWGLAGSGARPIIPMVCAEPTGAIGTLAALGRRRYAYGNPRHPCATGRRNCERQNPVGDPRCRVTPGEDLGSEDHRATDFTCAAADQRSGVVPDPRSMSEGGSCR